MSPRVLVNTIQSGSGISLVSTEKSPKAIGPYSQATIYAGPTVYISGQIPLHPETGAIVGGTIKEQAKQVPPSLARHVCIVIRAIRSYLMTPPPICRRLPVPLSLRLPHNFSDHGVAPLFFSKIFVAFLALPTCSACVSKST